MAPGENLKQQSRRLLFAVLLLLFVSASWLLCCYSKTGRQSIKAMLCLRYQPFSKIGDSYYSTSDDASADTLIAVTNFALIDVNTNQTVVASLLNKKDLDNTIFVLDLDQLVSASSPATTPVYHNADSHSASAYNKLKLTIRVDAQGPVHYMVMDWDAGDVVRTSFGQPFALAGLDDHNPHPQEAPSRFGHSRALTTLGWHSLQATPFDVLGRAGHSRTLHLQVVGKNNDALNMPSSLQKATAATASSIQQASASLKHFFIRPPTEHEQQGDKTDHSHDDDHNHHMHPSPGSRNNKITILREIINPKNTSTTPLNAM